jgi:hypothetical protein
LVLLWQYVLNCCASDGTGNLLAAYTDVEYADLHLSEEDPDLPKTAPMSQWPAIMRCDGVGVGGVMWG